MGARDIENRIAGIKVRLMKDYPFFGYLVNFVEFRETPDIQRMGISKDLVIAYNKEFVDKQTNNELLFLISHEILHGTMKHLLRKGNRNRELWNIACDIKVNDILVGSEIGYMPNWVVTGKGYNIENIRDKSVEEIYEELLKTMIKNGSIQQREFDQHIYKTLGNKKLNKEIQDKLIKEGKNLGSIGERELEEKLSEVVKEITNKALVLAKYQGNLPAGLEREFNILEEGKINWREILWKYITRELPIDYSWSRPNKRSRSLGVYIPYVVRENLDIVVAIDTSGSIGQKELDEFITEMIGIARGIQNVRVTMITCDADIQDEFLLYNGNIAKAKKLKMHGGGGTDFRPLFKRAKELGARLLIYFTDGYGDYPDNEEVRTIWVMTTDYNPPFGQVVRI